MALNWLEEVVSRYYKLCKYVVIENEDLQMPITKYRKIKGHSDIDIIAIKDGKLLHVECQVNWCPGKSGEKKAFRGLRDKFERTPDVLFKRYSFLRQYGTIIKRFVTSGSQNPQPNGPWSRLQEFCEKEGIELIEINTIIEDLIRELRERYPKPNRVGAEKGIARFLIHLIHNDFLQRPQE